MSGRLDNARATINGLFKTSRVPHAMLIEGGSSDERRELSLYIAKAAVCIGGNKPCDGCNPCHLVTDGNHPDVTVVTPEDGKKNIAVSQIREVRSDAFIKPHSADKRVFIIDKAQSMNEYAQNALLKVLEEPPAGVIFVLLADSRTKLLPTVISRCNLFSLPPSENASADNPQEETAQEFIKLLLSGDEMGMLKLLYPLEKSRVKAEEFFEALKIQTADAIKKHYREKSKSQKLCAFYEDIKEYENALKTNINLSLLFSAVVCRAKETT